MKKIITFCVVLSSIVSYSQVSKKALFIGNSYTYTNNLPSLISDLATADGNTFTSDQNTPGGQTLQAHSTNATTLSKIEGDQWDFVVLQDQSQYPSFPTSQVVQEVYPYAAILVDSIYSNNECSVPLFFNTWGRRDGDPQWDSINTFEKMNLRLYNAYNHMTDVNLGMLSPVGIGFEHILNDGASPLDLADLYVSDGSHPSVLGSYLAACMFYDIIFETQSLQNTYVPTGITAAEALYLQEVADHVVYGVDSIQIDHRALSHNTINVQLNGETVTVSTSITNGQFAYWNFGDGNTSTNLNATHTYQSGANYLLWMVSSNNCYTDSIAYSINLTNVSINENELPYFSMYPNPTAGKFYFKTSQKEFPISIFSTNGQLVLTVDRLGEYELEPGVYIVKTKHRTQKLVVQ